MKKLPEPKAVIRVNPWGFELACFDDRKDCDKAMSARIEKKVKTPNAYGVVHFLENDKTNEKWFALYLSEGANIGTVAHECSHVVDFMHEAAGLPILYENTELRAYQIGLLVCQVCEVFGFNLERE